MKKVSLVTRTVENGVHGMEEAVANAVKTLEGKRVRITIEEFKKPVSDKIKAYWFTVCIPIIQDILRQNSLEGKHYTKEEAHQFAKEYIWEWYQDVMFMGAPMRVILPMPKIHQKEWPELLRKSQEWAAKRGRQMPDPQEKIPDWVLEGTDWDYKL